MVRKEPCIGVESREDVSNLFKHVDKSVKVFSKFTSKLDLLVHYLLRVNDKINLREAPPGEIPTPAP